MIERRQKIAVAIRAAHRSLNDTTPATRLKRQRAKWQALHDGLHAAADFISTPAPTDSARRRLLVAADKVRGVYDDVQFGPNDAELPIGEIHPAASVLAVMKSTMNLFYWREANRTNDEYAIGHCDREFATEIQSALDNGMSMAEDKSVVAAVEWTNDNVVNMAIDQHGLFAPKLAP